MQRISLIVLGAVFVSAGCSSVPSAASSDTRGTASAAAPSRSGIPSALSGLDAHWGAYAPYLHEFFGTVKEQWFAYLNENRISAPRDSSVMVKFRLNAKGEAEIISADDHGAGRPGVLAVTKALTAQRFPKWTEAMIASLGQSQQLTISFSYQ